MADFKIGDRLMYGTVGLVEIIDIRVENAFGADREYYVLREQDSASDAQIFVPKDNEALVANMRPLLSGEEIKHLLTLEERAPIEWNKDNRARSEKFRRIIESGDREMILALISAIQKMRRERSVEGKKNYMLDENMLDKANRLIVSEFSCVLNKSSEQMREILSKI